MLHVYCKMSNHHHEKTILFFFFLLNQFSSEGDTHGTEEKSGILVSSSTGVDGNVTTGNHFGRVPECDTRAC